MNARKARACLRSTSDSCCSCSSTNCHKAPNHHHHVANHATHDHVHARTSITAQKGSSDISGRQLFSTTILATTLEHACEHHDMVWHDTAPLHNHTTHSTHSQQHVRSQPSQQVFLHPRGMEATQQGLWPGESCERRVVTNRQTWHVQPSKTRVAVPSEEHRTLCCQH